VIVVDASVIATALTDADLPGHRVRARLVDEVLGAPELLDLEVLSVMRRHVRAGRLGVHQAHRVLLELRALPIERASHHVLVSRCWELRDNLSPYDAAYVALAERLGVVLVTADSRLARAHGIRCTVEVLR
jgi:predicted nucleic acid-binding protein